MGGRILTGSALLSLWCSTSCRQLISAQNYLYRHKLLPWHNSCECALLPVTPGFSRFISSGCEGQPMLSVLTESNTEQMTYRVLMSAKIQIQQSQTLLPGAEPCSISCHSCPPSLKSLVQCITEGATLQWAASLHLTLHRAVNNRGHLPTTNSPRGTVCPWAAPSGCWLQSSTHQCLWSLFCCTSLVPPHMTTLCPSQGLSPRGQGVGEVLH